MRAGFHTERTQPVLHWQGNGDYVLPCAGSSHYHDALAAVAVHPAGRQALTFCRVLLMPEDNNPHDPQAVAVYAEGRKAAHLSRNDAQAYRAAVLGHGLQLGPMTCDAAISKGLATPAKSYSYALELDIDVRIAPRPASNSGPAPRHGIPESDLVQQGAGNYVATCWADQYAMEPLRTRPRFHAWRTDHWDMVNYYVENLQGIGLGSKLLGVPLQQHAEIFGEGDADVSLISLTNRWAKLQLRRVTG